ERYRQEIELRRRVLQLSPSNVPRQLALASALAAIAGPLRKTGRLDDARRQLEEALAIGQKLRSTGGFTRAPLGDLFLTVGDYGRALESYNLALGLARQRAEVRPQDMDAKRQLADCEDRLGAYYESRGSAEEASSHYRCSLEIWQKWTQLGASS